MSAGHTGRLLVTIDQFRVGGRESYLETYLGELSRRGYRASLLAPAVEPGLPALDAFDAIHVCGERSPEERLRRWLHEGRGALAGEGAGVIWAQHYDLVPAWLLSRLTRTPLLVTFHGPVMGARRPNQLLQAAGMALAIHRGDAVSAVSTEAAASVAGLGTPLAVPVFPNAVGPSTERPSADTRPPRRLLLIARREKVDHLRWSVLLFAAYQRRVPEASLAILSAESPGESEPRRRLGHLRRSLEVLGGRWCHGERRRLWRALLHVRWLGFSPQPRTLARQSDLVMGMGRALLEGLAEGRPGVLVGYDRVCGLATAARFGRFAEANFSGRGISPGELDAVCAEILELPQGYQAPDLSSLDPGRCAGALADTVSRTVYRGSEADERLARDVEADLEEGRGLDSVFARIAQALTPVELQSLYRLTCG